MNTLTIEGASSSGRQSGLNVEMHDYAYYNHGCKENFLYIDDYTRCAIRDERFALAHTTPR